MPKPIIKITVTDAAHGGPCVGCEISNNSDNSWHGLKELERAGLFEKLIHDRINIRKNNKLVFPSIVFQGALYLGGPLKPQSPKPKNLIVQINKDLTIGELIEIFKNIGFTAIVTDKHSIPNTATTTLDAYATKAEDAILDKINKELDEKIDISQKLKRGQEFPSIQTLQQIYHLLSNTPQDKPKLTKNPYKCHITFEGEDAIKHAIIDAINRVEEFDDNGNRPTCPITLEPFEGNNKVILILSKHPSDGTMHADFVHAIMRDGSKNINVAEYLQKTLKKNPATNDPIVAMESGTLYELKEKYRITRPLRPAI